MNPLVDSLWWVMGWEWTWLYFSFWYCWSWSLEYCYGLSGIVEVDHLSIVMDCHDDRKHEMVFAWIENWQNSYLQRPNNNQAKSWNLFWYLAVFLMDPWESLYEKNWYNLVIFVIAACVGRMLVFLGIILLFNWNWLRFDLKILYVGNSNELISINGK